MKTKKVITEGLQYVGIFCAVCIAWLVGNGLHLYEKTGMIQFGMGLLLIGSVVLLSYCGAKAD